MENRALVRCSAAHINIVFRAGLILFMAALAFAGCSSAPPTTVAPSPSQSTGSFEVSAQALDTVVKLSWSPVPNAAGYLIYRDGSQVPLNPKPVTDPTYEDNGLTNGRAYSYTVSAVDPTGNMILRSSEVRATPKSK